MYPSEMAGRDIDGEAGWLHQSSLIDTAELTLNARLKTVVTTVITARISREGWTMWSQSPREYIWRDAVESVR